MLKIIYEAETGDDFITPLTVAHALISHFTGDCDEYEDSIDTIGEIADHLNSFVNTQRNKMWREERKAELAKYADNGEVQPK